MSDADQRLAALLRDDQPPARDPAFRVAVLERLVRRQLTQRLACVAAVGAGATVVIAEVAPRLSGSVEAIGGQAALPALCVSLAVAVTLWAVGKVRGPI